MNAVATSQTEMSVDAEIQRRIEQFLYREARSLITSAGTIGWPCWHKTSTTGCRRWKTVVATTKGSLPNRRWRAVQRQPA